MKRGIGLGAGLGLGGRGKGPYTPSPTPTPAPSWSVQPSISGTPQVGQTLTGADGTVANGAVSARAWLRNGSAISGATGASYLLDPLDEGADISFRVTATGAGGSAQATSPSVGPVTATPTPTPATISAPTLALAVGTTTYPPQFDIGFDDTPEVGDTLRVQWADPGQTVDGDGIFTATVGSVNHVITSGEATANAASIGLSAISSGTYQYQAYIIRGAGHSPASNSVEHGPDITPPVLSSATAAGTGTTSATIGVDTETPEGVLYYVLTTSATAPSKAQVKAGQDNAGSAAAWSGSQAVSSAGAKTAGVTGLSPGTTYYSYFMHEDAAGNQSNIAAATSFATDASSPVTFHAAHVFDTQNVAYASNNAIFSGGAIGSAQTNRVCVACITLYDGGTNVPTGVTIGGVSATLINSSGQMSMWRAAVPTGTTANVSVTSAGNIGWVGCQLASIRTGSPVPTQTTSTPFEWSAGGPSNSVTIATDGLAIAFAARDSTGATAAWTNATARGFKANLIWSAGIATRDVAGTATITAGGFGSATNALLTASFGP